MIAGNDGFEIRKLTTHSDAAAVARVGSLAYTLYNNYSDANLPRMVKKTVGRLTEPGKELFGIFHTDPTEFDHDLLNPVSVELNPGKPATVITPTPGLLAHWMHRDMQVNLFGKVREYGGLAFVAVDMKYKKRGFAKILVTRFLEDCFKKGQALAALHPFRPDFYMNMGFGLSSPYYDYNISPASLPKDFVVFGGGKGKSQPTFTALKTLKPVHIEEMEECQNRFSQKKHGMVYRDAVGINEMAFFDQGVTRALGFRDASNTLRGYILFKFETTTAGGLINDLHLVELVYETKEAFFAFVKFLREQDDQIRYIKLTTQEPDLFRLLTDPRSGSAAGEQCGISGSGRESAKQSVSMMYRVVNTELLFSKFFADRNFNGVDGLKLWIKVEDSFTPELNPPVLLQFRNGHAGVLRVGGDHSSEADASLYIGIAEFSSLVVGAVSLKVLEAYGKAQVEPEEKLSVVSKLFISEDLPMNAVFF
ncbi:hypothetical protein BCR33DRAFT_721364 [Rhizoclosmatium globosum]|uniref:N-acetyltransferase domain-containing protein n=1 Tax=Rhizoclosmatium globosum TaxID=329046 RepID=A0A1Y2BSA7_9FUNG|nr:hypothetical protein BCR33DRAFT_721364 [Rhizoclosmatium globosum]|eukprot:ORY37630.1 hypothetical protein BCR33DRAFT_721364 [Rhizoclosmatium globosum]